MVGLCRICFYRVPIWNFYCPLYINLENRNCCKPFESFKCHRHDFHHPVLRNRNKLKFFRYFSIALSSHYCTLHYRYIAQCAHVMCLYVKVCSYPDRVETFLSRQLYNIRSVNYRRLKIVQCTIVNVLCINRKPMLYLYLWKAEIFGDLSSTAG